MQSGCRRWNALRAVRSQVAPAPLVLALLAATQIGSAQSNEPIPAQSSGAAAPVLLATAIDTGCVILRTGTGAQRLCLGDRHAEQGVVLIAVDPDAAIFRAVSAAPGPLDFRVRIGNELNAAGAIERLKQAVGPRPEWIQGEDSSAAPSQEDAR